MPDDEEFGEIGSEDANVETLSGNAFSRDPGIDDSMWTWLLENAEGPYSDIIRKKPIFSSFEFDRKVPLMFTLNVMCSYLTGYYQRNDRVRKFLDERSDSFPEREEVILSINTTAKFISGMKIPQNSIWWSKANFFTILVELARRPDLQKQGPQEASRKLLKFAQTVPDNYGFAAR